MSFKYNKSIHCWERKLFICLQSSPHLFTIPSIVGMRCRPPTHHNTQLHNPTPARSARLKHGCPKEMDRAANDGSQFIPVKAACESWKKFSDSFFGWAAYSPYTNIKCWSKILDLMVQIVIFSGCFFNMQEDLMWDTLWFLLECVWSKESFWASCQPAIPTVATTPKLPCRKVLFLGSDLFVLQIHKHKLRAV